MGSTHSARIIDQIVLQVDGKLSEGIDIIDVMDYITPFKNEIYGDINTFYISHQVYLALKNSGHSLLPKEYEDFVIIRTL